MRRIHKEGVVVLVRWAWFLVIASAACRRDRDRPARDSLGVSVARATLPATAGAARGDTLREPPPLPSRPGGDWKEFRGDGFVLRYPPDAILLPDTSYTGMKPGTAIRGPQITLDLGNPDIGPHTGPAYKLVVSSFPNPAGRSPEEWVDSVRRAYNDQDFDEDSTSFVAPPDSAIIAGQRALILVPYCGDCQPEEVYLVGPRRVVVVSKLYDLSIPGDQQVQWRLYDAILSTFRWTQ